jgi:hypothetical protein
MNESYVSVTIREVVRLTSEATSFGFRPQINALVIYERRKAFWALTPFVWTTLVSGDRCMKRYGYRLEPLEGDAVDDTQSEPTGS